MAFQSRQVWVIIVLLLIGLSPLVVYAAPAKQQAKVEDKNGLKVIYSNLIGVAVPSNGTKPMFFWWSQKDNSTVYWMKYNGLQESWLPPGQFKHDLEINDDKDYKDQFKKLFENTSLVQDEGRSDVLVEKTQNLGQLIKGLSINSRDLDMDDIVEKVNALKNEIKNWPDSSAKDGILNELNNLVAKMTELKGASNHGKPKDIANFNKVLRDILDLGNNIMKKAAEQVQKIKEFKAGNFKPLHPYFFPFSKGVWQLVGPSNITLANGTVIGMRFDWKLVKVPDSKWSFLEGNVEIRNRLYFETVEEKVNNTIVKLTRAELKSDIIIRKWEWNFNAFYKMFIQDTTSTTTPDTDSFAIKPSLSLPIHFTAIKSSPKIFDVLGELVNSEEAEDIEDLQIVGAQGGPKMRLGDEEDVDIELKETKIVGHANVLPGLMLAKNETVGGFFRFIPNATVTYPPLTESTEAVTSKQVKVRGFFYPAGRQVKAFLVYPYFANGVLEHDPSIGIVSLEVESEVEVPVAKVTVTGSTINVIPIPTISTQSRPLVVPTLGSSTALIGMAIVTAVCFLAIALSRRKKIDLVSGE